MMSAGDELQRTIDEYRSILNETVQNRNDDLHWELVQSKLSETSGWTTEGAVEITRLVREYGGFILRYALAVANVLNIEDGELGY
jgi:hypothetical protein